MSTFLRKSQDKLLSADRQKGFAFILLPIAVFLIAGTAVSSQYIAHPNKVSGNPVAPFKDGEIVLSEKVTYLNSEPQVGDRITFLPENKDISFIGIITQITKDSNNQSVYSVISGGSEAWSITRQQILGKIYYPILNKEEQSKITQLISASSEINNQSQNTNSRLPTLSPSKLPANIPTTTSLPSPTSKSTPSPTPTSKNTPTPTPTPIRLVPTATPVAKVTCNINTSVTSGWSPVGVYFGYSSSDESRVVDRLWDLDGNGTWESEAKDTNWVYKDVGSYEAKLKLKLSDGSYSDVCSKTITVNPPLVTCNINASTTSGQAPLAVNFYYGAEFKGVTDDYVADVQWDFNGDGAWDTPYDYLMQTPPIYTFSNPGSYTVKMHLKTHKGTETNICTKNITVN